MDINSLEIIKLKKLLIGELLKELRGLELGILKVDIKQVGTIVLLDATALEVGMTNLEVGMTTLEVGITTLEGDITTLEGGIIILEGDIIILEEDITTLEGDITTLEGGITTLEVDITIQEEGATTQVADIAEVGTATLGIVAKEDNSEVGLLKVGNPIMVGNPKEDILEVKEFLGLGGLGSALCEKIIFIYG